MNLMPRPANNDEPIISTSWGQNQKVLAWLSRMSQAGVSFESLGKPLDYSDKTTVEESIGTTLGDDWQMISAICGYAAHDFISAGSSLPLTAAEVDHFRRNHRGTESHVSRDFMTAKSDLPSPLAELYGLYLHRARVDAEATLFIAQATGSTRVARVMADLLCVGGFANGLEYISHMGITYSVPAAFDTSDLIDRANHEAARRLAMPVSHPAHLLKLTHDEIGVLASNIAEKHVLSAAAFLEKANLLAEARQDVTRLPTSQHFTTAIIEQDLPMSQTWTMRLCAAYARIFETWVAGLPEVEAVLQ
jgi:hypothetical protein